MNFLIFAKIIASLAQLVEQLIRNEQVVGSSPIGGSKSSHIIFITASNFLASGHDFVMQIEDKIILIDGDMLANLMIENNIGVIL